MTSSQAIVQSIFAGNTVTTPGSVLVPIDESKEFSLIINVTAAPTGTAPTLQFTLQEVDPGDGATVFGATALSAVIVAVGVYRVTLQTTFGALLKVSWALTGTTPSFTDVYATLTSKAVSPVVLYDTSGIANIAVNAQAVGGVKATYSASFTAIVPAATPTDVFVFVGSATKAVRLVRLILSGIQTTVGHPVVQLIKRSADDTGGTSTTATLVPHDSTSPAATAVFRSYTANPALGAAVGTVKSRRPLIPAAATAADGRFEYKADLPSQGLVLRGVAQIVAVNLNAVTLTGGALSCDVEWTEE